MIHHPNKDICTGTAAGGEGSRESAKRICCRQWMNAVSEQPESVGSDSVDGGSASSVHPSGQPISHSTNMGFNRRGEVGPAFEDRSPSVSVAGSGRGERSAMIASDWPLISSSSERAPDRALRDPVVSATAGVDHKPAACVASPSPAFGEIPARLWLPLTVGVAHCAVCAASGTPPAPKL